MAAVLVAAGGVLVPAGPAHAVTVDQVCVGTWSVTYNPGITNNPRTVDAVLTGFFPNCTNPGAPNGSYVQRFTDTVSCTTILSAAAANRTFLWGDQHLAPSLFEYNWTVTDLLGQVVVTNTGMITSGTFAPDSAEQVTTLVTPNALLCATTGVTSVTGPSTLTVYQPG